MDQLDDILRTFKNEVRQDQRSGKDARSQKLMRESLLIFRFRGITLKYAELFIALESIVIVNASTAPKNRQNKVDTSAPTKPFSSRVPLRFRVTSREQLNVVSRASGGTRRCRKAARRATAPSVAAPRTHDRRHMVLSEAYHHTTSKRAVLKWMLQCTWLQGDRR